MGDTLALKVKTAACAWGLFYPILAYFFLQISPSSKYEQFTSVFNKYFYLTWLYSNFLLELFTLVIF